MPRSEFKLQFARRVSQAEKQTQFVTPAKRGANVAISKCLGKKRKVAKAMVHYLNEETFNTRNIATLRGRGKVRSAFGRPPR